MRKEKTKKKKKKKKIKNVPHTPACLKLDFGLVL
jgi:hypothetical protein